MQLRTMLTASFVQLPWSLSWLPVGCTVALRPAGWLLENRLSLIFEVSVPSVIHSDGVVPTSWAEVVVCPRVVIFLFTVCKNEALFVDVLGSWPRWFFSLGFWTKYQWAWRISFSIWFLLSFGVVLLSCHCSFFTKWPCLWQSFPCCHIGVLIKPHRACCSWDYV